MSEEQIGRTEMATDTYEVLDEVAAVLMDPRLRGSDRDAYCAELRAANARFWRHPEDHPQDVPFSHPSGLSPEPKAAEHEAC
jgi:hypothetical protein